MTTTVHPTEAVIDDVLPWAEQPRPKHQFTAEKLADLEASIRRDGIILPLLVRPNPHGGGYLLIDGECRWTAGKRAGLKIVPITVREMSDAKALSIALTTSIHRKDLHDIEELEACVRLQKMDPACMDLTVLAAAIGKPVSHVKTLFRLERLEAIVRAAFLAGAITRAHADQIVKLKPNDQIAALEQGCFMFLSGVDNKKAIKTSDWAALAPALDTVANLKAWIERCVTIDLKNEAVQEDLIHDLRTADPALTITPARIATCRLASTDRFDVLPGVLSREVWKDVNPSKPCDFAIDAIVQVGERKIFKKICIDHKCKAHWPPPAAAAPPPAQPSSASASSSNAGKKSSAKAAAPKPPTPTQLKEQLAERIWKATHARARLALFDAAVKLKPTVELLELAVKASGDDVLPSLSAFQKATGIKVTDKTLGAYLALCRLAVDRAQAVDDERDMYLELGEEIGVDVKAIEKAIQKELAAKEKKAAPPATAKSAKAKAGLGKKAKKGKAS